MVGGETDVGDGITLGNPAAGGMSGAVHGFTVVGVVSGNLGDGLIAMGKFRLENLCLVDCKMVWFVIWRADRSFSSSSSIRFLIISPKLVSWSNAVSLRWLVFLPPSSWHNLPIAAMTWSSGVTPGFVRYLCLWKTFQKFLRLLIYSSTLSRRDSAQTRCLKYVLCCSIRKSVSAVRLVMD